ncbi:MAG: LCP family protein [Clostridia bacterium]|nr:LCP family protein [Clostridia bacterium]
MSENITNEKKEKKGKVRIIILAILLLLLVAAVSAVVYTIGFHEPDDQTSDTKPFDYIPVTKEEPQETETEEPVEEPETEKTFNFLLLGKDQTSANTDVIMIINFNVTSGGIAVLQLPRDTYIELNKTSYKLNALYYHFVNEAETKKEKDADAYSLSKVATTLEQNLCINIHYYAMVNLVGFRNIVDILGGVEVDIPANMTYHDDSQNLHINLKKGKQVLDGKKAEMFVRFRSGYVQADIGRMDAQKIFMSALLKTVKENFTVSNVVKIANEVYKNVVTDVPLDDMIYFGKALMDINMDNIVFMSMPGSAARSNGDSGLWYYIMNRKAMIPLIEQHFNIYDDVVINDDIFDPNRVFTSPKKYPHIDKLYNAEPDENQGGSQSAEDINDGSIHIPRT